MIAEWNCVNTRRLHSDSDDFRSFRQTRSWIGRRLLRSVLQTGINALQYV